MLNLDDLRVLPRHKIEQACIAACQIAYLGDDMAICRVLARYLMHVNTIDRSLSPNMMMNGYWETWITQAITRHVKPGMRVVDIGANIGYYTVLLADCVGDKGKLWAFEPNPAVYKLLTQSVEINGFSSRSSLLCKACGATDGERLILKVPIQYQGSAALQEKAFDNFPELELTKVECETLRLDTAIDEHESIDFIKIDAEGAEPEIWEGMQGVLRYCPKVTIAMEFAASGYQDPAGFIDQITADGFELRIIDFDALIRKVARETLMATDDWCMLWLQRK